jgi:hypothetical protein
LFEEDEMFKRLAVSLVDILMVCAFATTYVWSAVFSKVGHVTPRNTIPVLAITASYMFCRVILVIREPRPRPGKDELLNPLLTSEVATIIFHLMFWLRWHPAIPGFFGGITVVSMAWFLVRWIDFFNRKPAELQFE